MNQKVRKFSRDRAQPHPQTYTPFPYLTPCGAVIVVPAALDNPPFKILDPPLIQYVNVGRSRHILPFAIYETLLSSCTKRGLYAIDKLLLVVPRMALTMSAKAFSVSAPSVWNSLTYNYRSAERFSTFSRILKTELFEHSA